MLAIAPFASLERMLRLATTGFYGDRAYPTASLLKRGTVRSLAASAPDDTAVQALLANRDPDASAASSPPSTRPRGRSSPSFRRAAGSLW